MINSFVDLFIGIILIILWIPISYYIEVNNKGNRKELDKLKTQIDNIKLTKTELDFNSNITTKNNVSENILLLWPKTRDLASMGNYLLEVNEIIITRNKKMETNNTLINRLKKKKYSTDMHIDNYKYLVKNHLVNSFSIKHNNIEYDFKLYTLIPDIIDNLYKVSGILDSQETSTYNKFDLILYDYEEGPPSTIPDKILNRKTQYNIFQKWGGRLGVFLILLFGLILLISPIEYIQTNFVSYIPFTGYIFQLLIDLYKGFAFIFSLIATIVLTILMYLIVNYPILALVTILMPFIIKLSMLYVNKPNTDN